MSSKSDSSRLSAPDQPVREHSSALESRFADLYDVLIELRELPKGIRRHKQLIENGAVAFPKIRVLLEDDFGISQAIADRHEIPEVGPVLALLREWTSDFDRCTSEYQSRMIDGDEEPSFPSEHLSHWQQVMSALYEYDRALRICKKRIMEPA